MHPQANMDVTDQQADFTTLLPNEVSLPNKDKSGNDLEWGVAITDFAIEGGEALFGGGENYAVLSDLAGESFIKGRYLPVLRIIKEETFLVTSLSLFPTTFH